MKRSPLRAVSPKALARRKDEAEFRRQVKARDNFRCQWQWYAIAGGMDRLTACTGPLEVHHIAPRSVALSRVLDLANGVTLCSSHHHWVTHHPAEAHAIGLHRYSWET